MFNARGGAQPAEQIIVPPRPAPTAVPGEDRVHRARADPRAEQLFDPAQRRHRRGAVAHRERRPLLPSRRGPKQLEPPALATRRAYALHKPGQRIRRARCSMTLTFDRRAALRPDSAPAYPTLLAHPPGTRGRSGSALASARRPHRPPTPAEAAGRDPHDHPGRPACDPTDPCFAQAHPADRSSAGPRSSATNDSACARAPQSAHPGAPRAPQGDGSAHPSATEPPQRPHGPGRRSPPPRHAPQPQIRQRTTISRRPTERLQFLGVFWYA